MCEMQVLETEFEGGCHISLSLVNFTFQLSNFVHEKFEQLHLTHF